MFGAGTLGAVRSRPVAERPRVIVVLPNIAESGCAAGWLATEGFDPVRRPSSRAAIEEMQGCAFDLLISDADLAFRDGLHIASRRRNPSTPTIVVGDPAAAAQAEAVGGQVMFLVRPIERALLVCTASMALLDARPLRRSPRKAVKPFAVAVNGVPSYVVDVSDEGLRLQMPGDARWVPPPYFSVRVPLIDGTVNVQRMWTRSRPGSGRLDGTWCGASLAQNRPWMERAWRGLVAAIPVSASTTLQTR